MGENPNRGRSAHEVQSSQQRRSLTPTPGELLASTYDTQSQCLLFAKMPVELREIIWHECVRGMVINLRVLNESLYRTECSSIYRGRQKLHSDGSDRVKLLSLLLTCRKV
jgi:hypothetical protein